MDMQKEREAFEAWFESRYDAHFMQFALDLDLYVDKHTQTCWEAWQAAKTQSEKALLEQFEINNKLVEQIEKLKAQAVPGVINIGNELQSWVAVNSFSADDGEGVLPVVDANALAEVIEKLTGANQ